MSQYEYGNGDLQQAGDGTANVAQAGKERFTHTHSLVHGPGIELPPTPHPTPGFFGDKDFWIAQ